MTLNIPTAPECQRCSNTGILREALRLRPMGPGAVAAAWKLGERLAASGDLPNPERIRNMTLESVEAVITKRAVIVPAHIDFEPEFDRRCRLVPAVGPSASRGAQCADEVGGGTGAGGARAAARSPTTRPIRPPVQCS